MHFEAFVSRVKTLLLWPTIDGRINRCDCTPLRFIGPFGRSLSVVSSLWRVSSNATPAGDKS